MNQKTRINGENYTQLPRLISQKMFNGRAGSTLEVSFTDATMQSGAPIDTPKQVKYGAPATSPSGIVAIDAIGNLTVLQTGPLFIKSRLRVGRTGASGISSIFFWVEISLDGGVVWNILGNSIDVRLDNSTENDVFFDFSTLFLDKGIKLRSMFARSSTGDNSGDLMPSTPSAALQAYGVPIAPSAQISIYRSRDYLYQQE
jgi:hypothetical protein